MTKYELAAELIETSKRLQDLAKIILGYNTKNLGVTVEYAVVDTLQKLGVPNGLSGYVYMKDILIMQINNPEKKKNLYREVAKKENVTEGQVSRCLYNAKRKLYKKGNKVLLAKIFGQEEPKMLDFIGTLAEYIRKQTVLTE